MLSPARALLNTRGARGEQAVGDIRNEQPDIVQFRLVQTEVPIPLGWALSYQAQYAIDGAMETKGNLWACNTIAQWLRAPAATDTMAVQSNRQLQSVVELKP